MNFSSIQNFKHPKYLKNSVKLLCSPKVQNECASIGLCVVEWMCVEVFPQASQSFLVNFTMRCLTEQMLLLKMRFLTKRFLYCLNHKKLPKIILLKIIINYIRFVHVADAHGLFMPKNSRTKSENWDKPHFIFSIKHNSWYKLDL